MNDTDFQDVNDKDIEYLWGKCMDLLPTGSDEREVLGVGSISVAIFPSCQDMKTVAL